MNDERVVMMFSGSAKATPAMIEYAGRAARRAIERGYMIYVGDNPNGIDLEVARVALEADYKDIYVVNVAGEFPRSLEVLYGMDVPKSANTFNDYHSRDMWMVYCSHICMFIWDGKSRGTKAAFDYAVELGDRDIFMARFENNKYIETIKIGADAA